MIITALTLGGIVAGSLATGVAATLIVQKIHQNEQNAIPSSHNYCTMDVSACLFCDSGYPDLTPHEYLEEKDFKLI